MQYKCDQCGHLEVLWNSRDGVTPFTIPCGNCGKSSTHVDWNRDTRAVGFLPQLDDDARVFVDVTKERAVEFATRRMLLFVDDPNYPAPPKDSPEWNRLIAQLTEDFYHNGEAPDITTAKELRTK
jgi:hypothetical protein